MDQDRDEAMSDELSPAGDLLARLAAQAAHPLGLTTLAGYVGAAEAEDSICTDTWNVAVEQGEPVVRLNELRETAAKRTEELAAARAAFDEAARTATPEALEAAEAYRARMYAHVRDADRKAQLRALLDELRAIPSSRAKEPPPRGPEGLAIFVPHARPRERSSRRQKSAAAARGDPSSDDEPHLGRPPAVVIELEFEAKQPRIYALVDHPDDVGRLSWWFADHPEIAAVLEAAGSLMNEDDESEGDS